MSNQGNIGVGAACGATGAGTGSPVAPYHVAPGPWLAGRPSQPQVSSRPRRLAGRPSLGVSPPWGSALLQPHGGWGEQRSVPRPQEAALCELAETLRGPRVQLRLDTALERRARVKELAEARRQALHASLQMAGFTRLATQVRGPVPAQCLPFGPILQFADDTDPPGLTGPSPQPCGEDTGAWRVRWLS